MPGDAVGARQARHRDLDVRDVDEWIGDSFSPTQGFLPAQGPHPGCRVARMVPHDEPTGEGQRFKSKDEILAECATVASRRPRGLSLLLQGPRASNTFLA